MAQTTKKVVCPSCQVENLPGTLFCIQCGTYLSSGGPLTTEPLPDDEDEPQATPQRHSVPHTQGQVLGLEVEILTSKRKVLLSVEREILVGRLDATQGIFPELDLTPDGALENGVSRRHARIYTQDGVCYIEDLNSSNHTLLNGQRLSPHEPYAFQSEDSMSLGSLEIKIHIYSD
jgi:pSer/pThr/pTyr-binding forkhead associated (FHA) protein